MAAAEVLIRLEHKDDNYTSEDDRSVFSLCMDFIALANHQKGNLGGAGELKCCHQCHRNDKGRVVFCSKSRKKRYCVPCITKWCPKLKEEDLVKACPFCRDNCNCRSCLRLELSIKNTESLGTEDKLHHSKYLLKRRLHFVRQFNEEQIIKREMDAKIQGLSISEVQVQAVNSAVDGLQSNLCSRWPIQQPLQNFYCRLPLEL